MRLSILLIVSTLLVSVLGSPTKVAFLYQIDESLDTFRYEMIAFIQDTDSSQFTSQIIVYSEEPYHGALDELKDEINDTSVQVLYLPVHRVHIPTSDDVSEIDLGIGLEIIEVLQHVDIVYSNFESRHALTLGSQLGKLAKHPLVITRVSRWANYTENQSDLRLYTSEHLIRKWQLAPDAASMVMLPYTNTAALVKTNHPSLVFSQPHKVFGHVVTQLGNKFAKAFCDTAGLVTQVAPETRFVVVIPIWLMNEGIDQEALCPQGSARHVVWLTGPRRMVSAVASFDVYVHGSVYPYETQALQTANALGKITIIPDEPQLKDLVMASNSVVVQNASSTIDITKAILHTIHTGHVPVIPTQPRQMLVETMSKSMKNLMKERHGVIQNRRHAFVHWKHMGIPEWMYSEVNRSLSPPTADSNSRVKLAFIHRYLPLGGIEREILTLCENLDHNIFDITVFVTGNVLEYSGQLFMLDAIRATGAVVKSFPVLHLGFFNSIETPRIDGQIDMLAALQVADLLRPFDVVYAFYAGGTYTSLSSQIAQLANRPAVVVSLANLISCPNPNVDYFLTISSVVARLQQRDFNLSNIVRISPAVDLSLFDPDTTIPLETPQTNGLTFGKISRLVPQKDLPTFIHAASIVHAQYPETQFLIYGDGILMQKIVALAKASPAQIHIMGPTSTPERAIAAMDVVVHNTLFESFCYAIVEALAMSKPVISTKVGSVPELIREPWGRMHNQTADVIGLANEMIWMIHHASQLTAMGQAGRNFVKETFSMEAYKRNMTSFLLKASAEKRERVAMRPSLSVWDHEHAIAPSIMEFVGPPNSL